MDLILEIWNELKALDHWGMHKKKCIVNRETIDSALTAYNNSCAETRSEARDAPSYERTRPM